MEPFVHLPEFPFVICKSCEFGCVAGEVSSHIRVRHGEIDQQARRRITEVVRSIPGLAQSQADLAGFTYPSPTAPPIPFIEAAKEDGLRCRECSFIMRHAGHMKDHCRKEHGWQNPRKRGGRVKANWLAVEHELLWVEGV